MKAKCPTRFTTGILLVLWLLIGAGADVNARTDGTGSTPLHFAVLFRGLSAEDIVSSLIEAGAAVNARSDGGLTPLHVAINHYAVIALIEAGADVNAISDYGSTPLDSAVYKGYDLVADTLIEAGGRSGQHY